MRKSRNELHYRNIFFPIHWKGPKQKSAFEIIDCLFPLSSLQLFNKSIFCNNHKLSAFVIAYYYRFYLQNCNSTHCAALMLQLLYNFLCWLCTNLAFPLRVIRLFMDWKIFKIYSPVKKSPSLTSIPKNCRKARHFYCVLIITWQKVKMSRARQTNGGQVSLMFISKCLALRLFWVLNLACFSVEK